MFDSTFFVVTVGGWFVFMVLAIINGVVRNTIYKPKVGDLRAHQISSVVFIVLILIVTCIIFHVTAIQLTDTEALAMGGIWLVSTILFEFGAGHYVFKNPWQKLVTDYNLLKGRVWLVVLLVIFLASYLINLII
jgi:hypothetical protein